jgi:hypothetical protein
MKYDKSEYIEIEGGEDPGEFQTSVLQPYFNEIY